MLGFFSSLDLRWLTAICQMAIGGMMILTALRLWFMPLHERAILFEPYLTTRGARLLLDAWPLVFVCGAFLIVSGVSKWVYYLRWQGQAPDELAGGVSLMEAIFAIWAAGSVAVVAVRAWRGR